MAENPLVSIIIPAFNSEKTIGKCLQSVRDQTYSNLETIVVDCGSRDGTVEIADGFGVKIIKIDTPSMTKQTNMGAAASKGKYLYRLDSDVVLSNSHVNECVIKCEEEGLDAVATYWGPDPSIGYWAKIRKFEKDCYKYDLSRVVARFYRRDVFERIGGYREDIVAGEDYDIQNRLLSIGCKIGTAETEGLHLGEPKSIGEILKKQYFYGKTIHAFLEKNGTTGLVQFSPFRISLMRNWRKFLSNPELTIGFIFYQFIVYTATAAGYVASYLPENDTLR
jgi:glycosyltransferase involved in cell wall biosynthesis